MADTSSLANQQIGFRELLNTLNDRLSAETSYDKLQQAHKFLAQTQRRLQVRLKGRRAAQQTPPRDTHNILQYCRVDPGKSIKTQFGRIERAFRRENWLAPVDIQDPFASLAQFSGLGSHEEPAKRVVCAAVQLSSRSAYTVRIGSIIVASAVDDYINDNGTPHSELKSALNHLLGDLAPDNLDTLRCCRNAGEWLVGFFHEIPLGAIFMMGRQTTLWGNKVKSGYRDAIIQYCRSLPDFIHHAAQRTPIACKAIRDWASGCSYVFKSDSTLEALLCKQERRYGSVSGAGETRQNSPEQAANFEGEVVQGPVGSSKSTDLGHLPNIGSSSETNTLPAAWTEENLFSYNISTEQCQQLLGETNDSSIENASPVEMYAPCSRSLYPTINETFTHSISSIANRGTPGFSPRCDVWGQLVNNHYMLPPFLFNQPGLPSSPPLPDALLAGEHLFRLIRTYTEDCCRKMVFDDLETLLAPNGSEFQNDLCNDFDSYCFTATMFMQKGSHVEFRLALNRACDLVKDILQAEHPRALACFFEVFVHLTRTGLSDVAVLLCDYVVQVSATVNGKAHLWSQIWRSLSQLGAEWLSEAMIKAWRCIVDVFDRQLGTIHRLSVSVRLDYMKRVITDHSDEERLLRDLLRQFGAANRLPTPRPILNLAHNLNKQGRYNEAEEMASQGMVILQDHDPYAGRVAERIESLKIVSFSQYRQGKTMEAETTQRQAIEMIKEHWGPQHSWVVEFMNVLEGWLREQGPREAADILQSEIQRWIEKDQIDEQA